MKTNKEYLRNTQYKNAENLSARQSIYQYSENPTPFWEWAARFYPISTNNKILEVGCGNGIFWHDALKIFPQNIDITLTDFSAGMLEDAKRNLSKIKNIKFAVEDVEHLSYADDSFDLVIAHFMLYHASSPKNALIEIKRVVKPTGFCGIVLPSENHMQALFSILECENPRQARFFSAEKAMTTLADVFSSIEQHVYLDTFKISDVSLLINYVRSLPTMDKKPNEFWLLCEKKLHDYIKSNGSIKLSSSQYLFIAYNC
ncbi:MAG: class I SAM-dependent methyltransferase [Gammaproteobacteria bacterium]|nr:class I SAM-dependent methyltransferase [Gammaproteobacteria bacterium]